MVCRIKNRHTFKSMPILNSSYHTECRFVIRHITQTQTETETEAVRSHEQRHSTYLASHFTILSTSSLFWETRSCFHAEKICLVFLSINIEVADHELLAIVGQVGCGKSSLISTMLGETKTLKGQVTLKVLHLEYISCAFSSDNTKWNITADNSCEHNIVDCPHTNWVFPKCFPWIRWIQ